MSAAVESLRTELEMSVAPLPVEPPPPDARGELKVAINKLNAINIRLETLLSAIETGRAATEKAADAVETARQGVAAARDKDAVDAANAALKGQHRGESTARQARLTLLEAEEEAELEQAALSKLEARLPGLQDEIQVAQIEVEKAKFLLVKPFIEQGMVKANEAYAKWSSERAELFGYFDGVIAAQKQFGDDIIEPIEDLFAQLKDSLSRFGVNDLRRNEEAKRKTRAFIDALSVNADEPPPSI
jgi:hypothetical protein